MTRVAGVIGWPLGYTASPALHNAAYRALGIDATYVAFPVARERLGEALAGVRALGFLGVNVTVPYKEAVVPLCDELEPAVRSLSAANTLVVRDGRLAAHNTDVPGFRAALAEAGVASARAVVLGGGGAARAVVAALAGTSVAVVARSSANPGARAWDDATFRDLLPGADLLVDATSAGLDDAPYPAPVPLALLPPGAVVASLVYHREPAILAAARARGLRAMDGAGMLVHQAALAFELMTGKEAPLGVMWTAMRAYRS